jgi:hypothetical protein
MFSNFIYNNLNDNDVQKIKYNINYKLYLLVVFIYKLIPFGSK